MKLSVLAAAIGLVLSHNTHAAPVTWTGTAGDNLWSTPANWSTGQTPGTNDDVLLDVTGSDLTVFLRGQRAIKSLNNRETIVIQGISAGGHAHVTLGVGATNWGTIRFDSVGLGYNAQMTVATNAALINSGRIEVHPGAGGNRTLVGNLVNLGEILVLGDAFWECSGGAFEQTAGRIQAEGTMRWNNGSFAFSGGEIGGSTFARNSAVTVADGVTAVSILYLGGNSGQLAGVVSPATTVVLHGSSLNGNQSVTVPTGVTNRGTILFDSVNAGYNVQMTVATNAALVNSGRIEVRPGAGGDRTFEGSLFNLGEILVRSNAFLDCDSSAGGGFRQTDGVLRADGSFRWTGGTFEFLGGQSTGNTYAKNSAVTVAEGVTADSILYLGGNSGQLAGVISPATTVVLHGSSLNGNQSVTVPAGVTNLGTILFDSVNRGYNAQMTVVTNAALINSGRIEVRPGAGGSRTFDGQFVNQGLLHLTGAVFDLDGPIFLNDTAGIISGLGTINVAGINFTNAGTVSPGVGPGLLTFTGPYRQNASGRLLLEIEGTAPATQYDRLAINGPATLGGTLSIVLLGDFLPRLADSFQVMTFVSRNGAFSAYEGLNFQSGLALEPIYSGSALNLQAMTPATNVVSGPVIIYPPTNFLVGLGGTAAFAVTAGGTRPLQYQWEFEGIRMIGATNRTLVISPARTNDAGSYRVVISNSASSVTSAVVRLTVDLYPPISRPGGPYVFGELAATNGIWYALLDGSASTDNAGITIYLWNFGDGSTTNNGPITIHGWTNAGPFNVELTVFDTLGIPNSNSTTVTFNPGDPPVAVISGPRFLSEDVSTNGGWFGTWDAGASTDDRGTYLYKWNFGDGSNASGIQVTHSYLQPGIYALDLTVYDHANQAATVTQRVVVATAGLPTAHITASSLTPEGSQPIAFSALTSTDDRGIQLYRWLLPAQRFEFPGNYIDPNQWSVANAVQDDALIVTGQGDWTSASYLSLRTRVLRGGSIEGRVDTSSGASQAMVGLRNLNISAGTFSSLVYALYFFDGQVQIYEKGVRVGTPTNYVRGSSYDFRIETKAVAGARYFLRPSGTGDQFIMIFETGNHSDTAFGFGAHVYSGVFGFDDIVVDHAYVDGSSITTPVFSGGTVILEVVDHASQTNATSVVVTSITGVPPVAVINGPSTGKAGVEIPFDAYGSSDDHAIASYTWDFGDGSLPVFGPAVAHRFDAPGVYTCTVTVRDYAAQAASASVVVAVLTSSPLVCVPWRIINDIELPHETWSGKSITLKAVGIGLPLPFDYVWDFGDGSASMTNSATTTNGAYSLEASHIYTASEDTPFSATIRVVLGGGTVLSGTYPILVRPKTLDVEMNVAIDEGLWWLHKTQTRHGIDSGNESGEWTFGGYEINVTASAVQAFAVNGHTYTDDAARDPYVQTVLRGVNYLLTSLKTVPIGLQAFGDPDGNHNGIGLSANSSRPIYETGPVMDAFVAAARPDLVVPVGGAYVKGRTFKDIMQDMVDMYCWGQSDGFDIGGGWRYNWNDDPDNSASQWGAIGLLVAERFWGMPVPTWVKERNLVWVSYSRGEKGFGYTGSGDGPATTPSGMIQLAFDGVSTNNSIWRHGESVLATNWNKIMNLNDLYANYAIAKALRIANPQPVQTLSATGNNWFLHPTNGLARITVDRQLPDGSWLGTSGFIDKTSISTAWSVLILSSSIFQKGPVAVVHVRPNPAGVGYPVSFDGRGSYHQHPSFRVSEWRWDLDDSDGIDFDHPDAVGPVITQSFSRLGTNTISLQVRDNGIPQLNDSDSIEIRVGLPPFPPTADPAGPYVAAVGEEVHVDGSGSFDIDAALGDSIQSWDWEIDFERPLDFADGVSGARAVVVGGFATAGQYQIGLRVTDATAIVFPASGKPNQTHDAFTTVNIYNRLLTNLVARAKQTKCQLVWTKVGDYAVVKRSQAGPNHGFEEIGRTDSAYASFLDSNIEYNVDYFYRVYPYQNGSDEPLGVSDAQHAISRPLGAGDHPPYFVSTPSRTAVVGYLYEVQLQARDPENDFFFFNVLTNPPGMTLDRTNGLVRFTPAPNQIGSHAVSFEVTNASGRSVLSYDVVVLPVTNTPPAVFVNGSYAGIAGQPVEFSSTGTHDIDGDSLSYVWAFGDGTSSAESYPAHVYTAPGEYTVTLVVNDGHGGTTPAFTTARISRANRLPVANAGPNQITYVARTVRLDGSASFDLDSDPLHFQWSFVSRPAGSSATLANAASSRPSFDADQPGTYIVQLIVDDGFANSLADGVFIVTGNSAPVADAGADQRVGPGQTAQLDGTRSYDADHDPLTYRWTFASRPVGSAAELVNTNTSRPTFLLDLDGGYEAQLIVNDGQVDSTPDTVIVTTRNFPPTFLPGNSPPTNAIPNVNWHYDLVATDSYETNLTITLVQGPSGMTLTPQPGSTNAGVLNWTPSTAQLGDQSVTVRVTDSEGASVDQTFSIHVRPDVEGPTVSIELVAGELGGGGQWAARLGSTATFKVTATDNADGFLPASALGLRVGTETVALDSQGRGSVFASNAGYYSVVAMANDAVGNLGTTTNGILFYDPSATNSIWVQIHSPTNFAPVTKLMPIIASITNATDLISYRVDFARGADVDLNNIAAAGPQFTLLTNVTLPSGTRVITNATLAWFDPTILLNDEYVIRVIASDGRSLWHEPTLVSVSGELKFGELRLEFTDLAVPLVGIPISVTRVYDSREATKMGEFGYGWRLGLRDANIRKTLRQGSMFLGSHIYLTAPNGRRVGFTTKVDSAVAFGFTFLWIGFDPEPGIYEKLEIDGDNVAFYINGELRSGFNDPFSPTRFRLTEKDGTVYTYDQRDGLQQIRDLNNNTVTFATNGIFHSSGARIEFVRDGQGRISEITDPNGKSVRYTYDALGDLHSFSDLVNDTTRYSYSTRSAHYLTNIVDPLGRSALTVEYDSAGRVSVLRDANGNPISQDFDLGSNSATFTDGNGNVIHALYDDNGNEVVRRIEGISTNYFAYDLNNNLLASTNGRGFSMNYSYDAQGNLTMISDSFSSRTMISYNSLSKPVTVTNALGQTFNFQYDASGQLTQTVNNAGLKITVTRDDQGRVTSRTDATGTNTTIFDYTGGCACGQPGKVINPDGSFRIYEYNALGLPTRVLNELGAEALFHYDDRGKLLWVRDPLNNLTQFFYNGPLLTNVVDALGRSKRYEYDPLKRMNRIIDAENGIVEFRYDNNGNRTHVIDALTNVTTFVYDANRLKMRIDPLGHTNFFAYDAAGNHTEAIDRNGRRRTFAYDPLNRMTNELWWEGTNVVRSIAFGFNALGLQVLAVDPVARYDYAFDALNRLERMEQSAVIGQPDFSLAYTYTALGQIESVTDNYGVRVDSAYDNRNRLARRTWQGPGVDPASVDFVYDVAGSRTRTDRFTDLAGTDRIGFTTNAYNTGGIVTSISHVGGTGAVLARYDYNFDANYQIRQWTINSQLSTFAYDSNGQLTNALNAAQPNEAFRFDANGNRAGANSGGSYVVGGNNQILSDGTNRYTHDSEGNLVSRSNSVTGVATEYKFDHRNRLMSVTDHDGRGVTTQAVTFTYDVMNRRLSKTVNGQVTRFLYNQDDSWADLDGLNVVIARYLHGARIDELLARQRLSDGRGWYLTDHLGTVRDVANAADAVAAHVDYRSFGYVLSVSNPTVLDRFLFTGREFDGETGLYFFRTRYYDPVVGRFISEDPLDFAARESNLYRYVHNSPLNFRDPFGLADAGENGVIASIQRIAQPALCLAMGAAAGVLITAAAEGLGVPHAELWGFVASSAVTTACMSVKPPVKPPPPKRFPHDWTTEDWIRDDVQRKLKWLAEHPREPVEPFNPNPPKIPRLPTFDDF